MDADEQKRLEDLLDDRLNSARKIQEFFEAPENENIEGKSKFLTKVKSETEFLQKFASGERPLEAKYLQTSNLVFLWNIVKVLPNFEKVNAVFHSVTLPNEYGKPIKLKLDIVAENRKCWAKVISRSPEGICMDWLGSPDNNVLDHAEKYVMMARAFYQVDRPRVVFHFCSGVPDKIAERIERMGIEVVGKRVPIQSCKQIPDHVMENLEDEIDEELTLFETPRQALVNLDVSAVFVLISNITHPGGCQKRLASRLLRSQAEEERIYPARDHLLAEIAGRKMIICQTAHEAVMNILQTVAGANENERAEKLFATVELVDDSPTERALELKETDRINIRNKTIFGTGDFHKAVTVTANKHFVQSALYQSVPFDVIVHASRALSEKKEEDYVGPR